MKTNKEFSEYVFEKAEKYKVKRAAMIRRTISTAACCLFLAFTVAIMGINGIFDIGEKPQNEMPKGRIMRMCSDDDNSVVPYRGIDMAVPTNVTTAEVMDEEIFSGNVYFCIRTYNCLENEYTVLKSAEDFRKYSSFISNIEKSGLDYLDKADAAASKADFSKTALIVLRVGGEDCKTYSGLTYNGVENGAYSFTLKPAVTSAECDEATDYYIIFVPREDADKAVVNFID